MPLPFDLEDWLTDAGDSVVRKLASSSEAALTDRERLVYEIWLLDTEARNGGLSQYFCNCGLKQWNSCVALASAAALPSFPAFADRVNDLLRRDPDPYLAILNADADDLWYDHQTAVVSELRSAVGGAP